MESQFIQSQMQAEGARLVAVEAELKSKLSSYEEKLSQALTESQQKSQENFRVRIVQCP